MSSSARNTAIQQLPRSVTEVAPGIYSVGAMVQADRMRTWVPREVEGWLPVQCYVLRDGDKLVLIDGGLPAIKEEVSAGLAPLMEGSGERRFFMTRRELDTILNLPWIVHDFAFTSAHCGGDLSPIDFFEKIDEASADAQMTSLTEVPFTFLKPGDVTRIGSLKLEMVRASIMVLPTFWFYEESTGTLFTSDCWSFAAASRADGPRIVGVSDTDLSVEAIRASLSVKFDWLRGIDNSPIAQDLEQLFAQRDVKRICPAFGCIIEGRDAVDMVLGNTLAALAEMAAEPWRSALAGWPRAAEDASSANA